MKFRDDPMYYKSKFVQKSWGLSITNFCWVDDQNKIMYGINIKRLRKWFEEFIVYLESLTLR